MKQIALIIPGQSEEGELHDMPLEPGTTVLEAIRHTGIASPQHYVLEDRQQNRFVQGQNLYQIAEDGDKFWVAPDHATVA